MDKKLKQFQKALVKFTEILAEEKTEIIRDSSIVRFMFCFDLTWKVIKEYLKIQGVECFSPRECFKGAFQTRLIEDDDLWLKMIDDRNNISHVYAEKIANDIYSHLPEFLKLMKALNDKLLQIK